ncbi:MAG: GxxExxY protein [Patescibacteria group bacterium]
MAMPADCADKNFPLKELTYKIRGILFQVQNDLGTKFQEKHYCRGVASLFKQNGIPFKEQVPVKVFYKGEFLGAFKLDFLIADLIVLEAKTTDWLTSEHTQQMIRYLEATGKPVGFLVNFRKRPLEIKRVVLTNLRNQRRDSASA